MAQTNSSYPRWLPLLGGLLGSTTCGMLLYAFSVFVKPLMVEFNWTVPQVALAYGLIILIFSIVAFPAGILSGKVGPRAIVLTGSLIMATGIYLVSTIKPPAPGEDATSQLYQLYLYYSLIGGIGGGMVYLPPISTAPKWWPDRRALAIGFTVVGLGLGSFLMGPIATTLINHFGSVLPVFKYTGLAMAIMGVTGALCLKLPPEGYRPPGWTPPAPAKGIKNSESRDYTFKETIRTPQFWLLYLAYFGGSFAGLMVIGLIAKHGIDSMSLSYMAGQGLNVMSDIPADVVKKISMQAATASSTLAVFNAAVRIAIGPMIDKHGSKKIFITLFSLQAAAMLALYPAGSSTLLLSAVAGLIGWNFGAMFTLFPATLIEYYGSKAQSANYGLLFTSFGIAGFFGPSIGGKLQASTGSFFVPFVVSAGVLAVAVLIFVTVKAPAKQYVDKAQTNEAI